MITAYDLYTAHKSPTSKIKELNPQELFGAPDKKEKKRSKYLNKWVVVDKINFQSEGEANYYLELKAQQLAGRISEFKRQMPFIFEINGVRIGKYIADFAVLNFDGSVDVIDYKSRFTVTLQLYKIKKSLMLALYGIGIKEVGMK